MSIRKNLFLIFSVAGCLFVGQWGFAQDEENISAPTGARESNIIKGFPRENITIEVENALEALIRIDNRDVAINGVWNFKDDIGQVLDEPVIIDQGDAYNNIVVIACRAPGIAKVTITENGITKEYTIVVESRIKQNQTEKEIEKALMAFIGDPGVKVRVLPPQSSIVGRNLTEAFGEEAAANLFAPNQGGGTISLNTNSASTGGDTGTGNRQEALIAANDFRPTIILEGEVANDIVWSKALNIAYAYSPNVVDLLSVKDAIQIRIKVKVARVSHDNDQNIGLQWRGGNAEADSRAGLVAGGAPVDANGDGFNDFVANNNAGFNWPLNLSGFSSGAPFWDIVQGNTSVQATINLLKTKNRIEVIQEPTLTVLNGQPASVVIGQSIPIQTTTFDANGNPIQDVRYVNSGTVLLITPLVQEEDTTRVNEDGLIPYGQITQFETTDTTGRVVREGRTVNSVDENGIMRLVVQPSISSSVGTDAFGNPIFNLQEVETRVALKEDESLVLGGIYDQTNTINRETVPFVEKIPVVGELFKNRQDNVDRQEIVFIITPSLVGLDEKSDAESMLTEGNVKIAELGDILLEHEENMVRKAKPTRISASEFVVRPYEEVAGLEKLEPKPLTEEVEQAEPITEENTASETEGTQSSITPSPSSRLEIVPRSEETVGSE